MTAARPHVPVLLDRVVELLGGAPDGPVADATIGAAGHAQPVVERRLDRFGAARLVGIDRDPEALELARHHLEDLAKHPRVRIDLVGARFDRLPDVLDELGVGPLAGLLVDLGISSMHVDRADRGFSYRRQGPLDMRMDPDIEVSAADLVNQLGRDELARILRQNADERFADRIAGAIVAARPLTTTTELAEVVKHAIPAAARRHGGHPATRTFQALRIAVNAELDALTALLPAAVDRLAPGGICVVLSYHSLEDRLVKRAFADAASRCTCPPGFPVCVCGRVPLVEHVVRRPERPDELEIAANPRAAAARLRAVRRLPEVTA